MHFPEVKVTIISHDPLPPFSMFKYCEYPAGIKTSFHSNKFFLTLFIIRGHAIFQEEKSPAKTYPPGTLIVLPPDIPYRWNMKEKVLMFQISHESFSFKDHKELASVFGYVTRHLSSVELGLKKAVSFKKQTDAITGKASRFADIILSIHVLELFSCALSCYTPKENSLHHHPAMKKALSYLKANLDKEIPLKELARHSSLGVSRLSQLFRENLGISPMQYLAKAKAEKATELLLTTNLSVTEISEQTGFASINYFSRFFRKQTGLSPQETRNRNIV